MKNLQTEWAFLLLDSLAEAGVTEVVISPGSRSTPFVIAASQNPRLRCYNVIDERTAAFFALGQARILGRPTLLLCTSGSAAAHYLPAIAEAGAAFLPLLVLTADRPFSLQDCGANQTLDQIKLFGHHVRRFYEIGTPQSSPSSLRALRRMMVQAVMATMYPVPGAVHLNVRAEKPLEPYLGEGPEEQALRKSIRNLAQSPISTPVLPRLNTSDETIEHLKNLLCDAKRGIFVCGPGSLRNANCRRLLTRLLAQTGFVLAAEAASQFRLTDAFPKEKCIDSLDTLLRIPSFQQFFAPDLIVQWGAPLTSGYFERFLDEKPECRRIVVAPYGWNDPHSTAELVIVTDLEEILKRLCHSSEKMGLVEVGEKAVWAQNLQQANQKAWIVTQNQLREYQSFLSEPQAIVTTISQLPKHSLLIVGNSLPIREIDTYCPQDSAQVDVLSQRGLSGIDGMISGAAGAACMTDRPVTLLLGDVSFLHDLSGLALIQKGSWPLVIVVIQNQGGRIFEQLPVARYFEQGDFPDTRLASHFLTPQAFSLASAAMVYGHGYAKASSEKELREALRQAYSVLGCTIIEAIVPPHSAREIKEKINTELKWALESDRILVPSTSTSSRIQAGKRILKHDSNFGRVFLHGFTGDPSSWDEVLLEENPKIKTFRPILLGHGNERLSTYQGDFIGEVDRIFRSIKHWREKENVKSLHLIGYSMGGRIALGILIRYPQLFSQASLISVHPGLKDLQARKERVAPDEEWIGLLESGGTQAFVEKWENQELFASQSNLPHPLKEQQRERRLQKSAQGLAVALRTLGLPQMPNYWDWLPWIRIPVHCIAGEFDQKFVAIAQEMASYLPQPQVTILSHCGHNPLLEQPKKLAAAIFS